MREAIEAYAAANLGSYRAAHPIPPPPPKRGWRCLKTAQRYCHRYPMVTAAGMLAGALLVSVWMAGDAFEIQSGFTHLPTMPFYPALLVTALLAGRGAAWTVTIAALVMQALWMQWSGEIEPEHAQFYIMFAVTMMITASVTSIIDGEWVRFRERARKPVNRPPDIRSLRRLPGFTTG